MKLNKTERHWWYCCMPYGMWRDALGRTILFNRAYQPIAIHDPKHEPPVHVPASAWMFKQEYDRWDKWDWIGPPSPPPEWVDWKRQDWFYSDFDPPWLEGEANHETRVRIMLIIADFLDGKLPTPREYPTHPSMSRVH